MDTAVAGQLPEATRGSPVGTGRKLERVSKRPGKSLVAPVTCIQRDLDHACVRGSQPVRRTLKVEPAL